MGANDIYLDEHGLPVTGIHATSREQELQAREKERILQIGLRKRFVSGTQYDSINETRAKLLKVQVHELPEHEKLHAYSTQLQEAIEFIASQMADGFHFEAADKEVQELLLTALKRSPALRGGYDEQDLSLANVVRDALEASDTPVRVRWDPVAETAWPEFWPSEKVRMDFDDDDDEILEKVLVKKWVWTKNERGEDTRRERRTEWFLLNGEAVMAHYWDDDQDHHAIEHLGLPFIPWTTLRVLRKSTSGRRGESVITRQAMQAAARFNAVEQTGYLIARYNSHGNLAVIGDGAALKAQMDERISKDVADILTFPGGTALQVLTLPTDATMVEHQREVLLEAMYGAFGLTRLDHNTVTGLGHVSGYALEILNRKTTGTFNRIRNEFVGDFKNMLNLILDVTAYKRTEEEELTGLVAAADLEVTVDEIAFSRMLAVDPLAVFPKREFTIVMGSGYVVDRVMLRDDFTAGLISRAEALRQGGRSVKEIETIQGEIDDEKPEQPEVGLPPAAAAAVSSITAGSKAKVKQEQEKKALSA